MLRKFSNMLMMQPVCSPCVAAAKKVNFFSAAFSRRRRRKSVDRKENLAENVFCLPHNTFLHFRAKTRRRNNCKRASLAENIETLMTLRRKTLGIIAVTGVALIALLYAVTHLIVMSSFAALEADNLR